MGLFSGDNEIGNILQEAVKLKSAQIGQKKKTYETWPFFVQHTIFHAEKDEFKAWRELPFDEKMAQAEKFKAEGNENHKKKAYNDAVNKYEESMSLFHYCYSKDPHWRKNNKGIDDDLLVLVDDTGEDDEEAGKIKQLRLSCCLNIAASKSKLGSWSESIAACNVALELDPSNLKALYRRAEAKVKPAGSTAYDFECAIKDLAKANSIAPDDQEIKTLLTRLRKEMKEQRSKDKGTFEGMFERGEVYEGVENGDLAQPSTSSSSTAMPKQDIDWSKYQQRIEDVRDDDPPEKRIADAELLRDLYMSNGKEDEAKDLNEKIQQSKKLLKEREKQAREPAPPPDAEAAAAAAEVDWENPTPEMIEDAKKYGIDLNDPAVRAELIRCQKEGLPAEGDEAAPPPSGEPTQVDDSGELFPPELPEDCPPIPWRQYILLFVLIGLIIRTSHDVVRGGGIRRFPAEGYRLLRKLYEFMVWLFTPRDPLEETQSLSNRIFCNGLGWCDEYEL